MYVSLRNLKKRNNKIINQIIQDLSLTNARQVLYHYENNISDIPTCPVCNNKLKWNSDKHTYRSFCSRKCTGIGTANKAKQTSKKNNNGIHHTQTDEYRKKVKQTSLDKYAAEHYSKTLDFKLRTINTNNKKFGVDYPAQNTKVAEKMRNTSLDRYGVDNYASTDECRIKMRKTSLDRYGVEHPMQNSNINKRAVKTALDNYYDPNILQKLNNPSWLQEEHEYKNKSIVQIARELGVSNSNLGKYFAKHNIPVRQSYNISSVELEVVNYLRDLNISNIIVNSRDIISPKELDIFLPDYNLAIEINGVYYHTEEYNKFKNYHLDKTVACQNKNIQLLHIYDNEWNDPVQQEIWKSMIRARLGLAERIYARKCNIKPVAIADARYFFDNNHLQGFAGGHTKLGLYYNNALIQCIILSTPRFNKKYKIELIRMASLRNIVVVGGVSKLLSCISDPLISYANRRYSVGKAYSNCGLLHSHDSPPGFQYTFSGIIVGSRHNFQKHKLDKLLTNYNADWSEWENMKANGYNRIWDCGNLVFTRK